MRLSRIVVGLACAASVVVGAASLALADDNSPVDGNMTEPLPAKPEDVIVFRQGHYKWMGDHFYGDMKKAAAPGYGGDVKQFAPIVANMAVWVRRIPTVFPKGTETGHETKALPAIWSNPTGFEQRATRRRGRTRQALDDRGQRRRGGVRGTVSGDGQCLRCLPPGVPRPLTGRSARPRHLGRKQLDPLAVHPERDAACLQRLRMAAEDLVPPALAGGDVGRVLGGEALDVFRGGDQLWCHVVLLALGGEQHLEQRDQGGRGGAARRGRPALSAARPPARPWPGGSRRSATRPSGPRRSRARCRAPGRAPRACRRRWPRSRAAPRP